MTVINHQPLKISDVNGNIVSVHDDGTAASPRITVGFDLAQPGARVSVGATMFLTDTVRLRDELNRLIKRHGSA